MTKRKGQYFLIILLFLATNTLYYFAQRDTSKLTEKSGPALNAQIATKDSAILIN